MNNLIKGIGILGLCVTLAVSFGAGQRSLDAAVPTGDAVHNACDAIPLQYFDDPDQKKKENPFEVKMSQDIKKRVKKALDWLVAQQDKRDGVWHDAGNYTLPISCMAGLALCSWAGPGEGPKPYREAIKKLTNFIVEHADTKTGYIFYNNAVTARFGDDRPAYGHAFGLLFLSQVYGSKLFKPDEQKKIYKVIVKAIRFIEKHQNPNGFWYQNYINGHNQIVTVSHIQALRAARLAGFRVNQNTIKRALDYNEQQLRSGSSPCRNASCTAVQLAAGDYKSSLLKKGVKRVMEACKNESHYNLSKSSFANSTHLYSSQIIYFLGDRHWKNYYEGISKWYVANQQASGSWPKLPNCHAVQPSEVYTTAIACIILQMPNKRLPLFQTIEPCEESKKLAKG